MLFPCILAAPDILIAPFSPAKLLFAVKELFVIVPSVVVIAVTKELDVRNLELLTLTVPPVCLIATVIAVI